MKYSIIFLAVAYSFGQEIQTFNDLISLHNQQLTVKTFTCLESNYNPFVITVENAQGFTVGYMRHASIDELYEDGSCVQQSLYIPTWARSIYDENYQKAVFWDECRALLMYKYRSIKMHKDYFEFCDPTCENSLEIIDTLSSMNIISSTFQGSTDYYWLNIPQAHPFRVLSDYPLMINKR